MRVRRLDFRILADAADVWRSPTRSGNIILLYMYVHTEGGGAGKGGEKCEDLRYFRFCTKITVCGVKDEMHWYAWYVKEKMEIIVIFLLE